jgi:hypothetical protein
MADIFASAPGTVAIMSDSKAIPGSIQISKPQFPSGSGTALISGIRYSQSTNQEFQTSLDGAVYIYVFGDHMGKVTVEGIVFPGLCPSGSGSNGLFDVLDYYASNRASILADPIIVKAGTKTIKGFLTGITVNSKTTAEEPEAPVAGYALEISALP